MTGPAVVCIPWRGGDQDREDIFEGILAWYQSMPWPVYTGDSDPALPFNRSGARNAAARAAGDWGVALFVDADTTLEERSINAAFRTGRAVLPFSTYIYGPGMLYQPEVAGWHVAGDLVIPRAIFDDVGGWDERFQQWGGEDAALCYALDTLHGLGHVDGIATTYQHDRKADETWATAEQWAARNPVGHALIKRYFDAHTAADQAAMRAVLVR